MTVQAQDTHTTDSAFTQIALSAKEKPELRKLALSRVTEQWVFERIALNNRESDELRKLALLRVTDQSVFERISLEQPRRRR